MPRFIGGIRGDGTGYVSFPAALRPTPEEQAAEQKLARAEKRPPRGVGNETFMVEQGWFYELTEEQLAIVLDRGEAYLNGKLIALWVDEPTLSDARAAAVEPGLVNKWAHAGPLLRSDEVVVTAGPTERLIDPETLEPYARHFISEAEAADARAAKAARDLEAKRGRADQIAHGYGRIA